MNGNAAKIEENTDTAQVILDSAVRLACREGLSGVTVRGVATEAGVAPSAIGYYFKSIAGLLSAVHRRIGEDLAARRTETLRSLEDPAGHLFCAESLCVAVLCDLLGSMGLHIILQQEFHRTALRGLMELDEAPLDAVEARGKFWQDLLKGCDADSEHAQMRGWVADGLIPVLLLDRHPFRQTALLAAVMGRLDDRLARRRVFPVPGDPAISPAPEPAEIPRGKRQIIDAAMRLLGQEGVAHLTHRKVAALAGVSLASTTYFYASKDDLIADAFTEIQRRAVHSVVNTDLPRDQFISSVILTDDGEERWEMAAMLELNRAAIRSSRYDSLAYVLRQVRGIDGMRWLRAQGCAEADQLDGILWSAVTTPIIDEALCLPSPERRAFLDRETARAFTVLFSALREPAVTRRVIS